MEWMNYLKEGIGRKKYFCIGFILVAVKYNLDRLFAELFLQQFITIFNLSSILEIFDFSNLTIDQKKFFVVMLLTSLPFIYLGVLLTVGRLKNAGLPRWLSALFFVPILNLVFFILLCLLPNPKTGETLTEERPRFLSKILPRGKWASAMASSLIVTTLSLVLVYFTTQRLRSYGEALFILLPFMMGMGAALLHGYYEKRSLRQAVSVACLSITWTGIMLLCFALEGVICLVMAAPVAYLIASFGGVVGYGIQKNYWDQKSTERLCCQLLVLFPVLLLTENHFKEIPPTHPVTSFIEIQANPEEIWPKIIQFQKMPSPTEWIFKTGVAYPVEAKIKGSGVGAVRYCVFSTGPFVEPITVWDPPCHLAFSVIEQPAPMDEMSPYHSITPPHLHGFFESERGEFRLEKISKGKTNVYGTTWYHHDLWPQFYWNPYTNWFIHKIHLRVLNHIKNSVETGIEMGN